MGQQQPDAWQLPLAGCDGRKRRHFRSRPLLLSMRIDSSGGGSGKRCHTVVVWCMCTACTLAGGAGLMRRRGSAAVTATTAKWPVPAVAAAVAGRDLWCGLAVRQRRYKKVSRVKESMQQELLRGGSLEVVNG